MSKKPAPGDEVLVHYRGTLEKGIEFDSTYSRNEAFRFVIGTGRAVLGFEEAVCRLTVGEKTVVELSPERAFGDHHDDLAA